MTDFESFKASYAGKSPEEMIKLLYESMARLSSAEDISKKLTKANGQLERKNAKLEKKNAELREDLRLKNAIIKRLGLEEYVDKSDNANNHHPKRDQSARFTPDGKKDGKPGRKKGSKNFSSQLEKLSEGCQTITNDILPEYMREHPDAKLVKWSEDVSFIIEHQRARFSVVKVVTPKYKTQDGKIVQAQSKAVISHSPMSAGSLAYFVTAKYSLGIPVYRMRYMLQGQGLDFSNGTIYGWLTKTADLLEPIWKEMVRHMADGTFGVLNIDETNLRVMEEMGESREKCYTYLYSGDSGREHIRVYDYTGKRNSDNINAYLKDFRGTIITDGYNKYDALKSDSIGKQSCAVHLRRYFTNITKVMNDAEREESEAAKVVDLIDRLFKREADFKKRGLDSDGILRERSSEEYMKAVRAVREKIEYLDGQILGADLRKAVNYYMNRKDDFWTYLSDGRVEMHNNAAERMAKSFATLRKGFLFCRTDASAKRCAILMSLVKTSEACDVYPDLYLEWALKGITSGRKTSELMPWSEECTGFAIDAKEQKEDGGQEKRPA